MKFICNSFFNPRSVSLSRAVYAWVCVCVLLRLTFAWVWTIIRVHFILIKCIVLVLLTSDIVIWAKAIKSRDWKDGNLFKMCRASPPFSLSPPPPPPFSIVLNFILFPFILNNYAIEWWIYGCKIMSLNCHLLHLKWPQRSMCVWLRAINGIYSGIV